MSDNALLALLIASAIAGGFVAALVAAYSWRLSILNTLKDVKALMTTHQWTGASGTTDPNDLNNCKRDVLKPDLVRCQPMSVVDADDSLVLVIGQTRIFFRFVEVHRQGVGWSSTYPCLPSHKISASHAARTIQEGLRADLCGSSAPKPES